MLVALTAVGLGMDRWFFWVHHGVQNFTASASSIYFPLAGWNLAILLLVPIAASLSRRRRIVLASGFICVGLIAIAMQLSYPPLTGGWLSDMFPRISYWHAVHARTWHCMSLRMAQELFWIGAAILASGPLVRSSDREPSRLRAVILLILAISVAAVGHWLVEEWIGIGQILAGVGTQSSWLSIHRGDLLVIVMLALSTTIWVLVLTATRRARWIAFPWLVLGIGLSALHLLSNSLREAGSVFYNKLYVPMWSAYGWLLNPWLASRLLLIGILALLLARARSKLAPQPEYHSL